MLRKLSLEMSNTTVYVSGTVNGSDYVFTLAGSTGTATIWEANVTRAANDVYHCEITAINAAGTSTAIETTLYYGLQLITDRTQTDVNYVKELIAKGDEMSAEELSQWLSGLKGYYCFTDLNRVENAVSFINDRFIEVGIDNLPISVKNTWEIEDIPTSVDMQRYLSNIEALKGAISLPDTVPDLPESMNYLKYDVANDIEKILLAIDAQIAKIRMNYIYSGEVYSGEV